MICQTGKCGVQKTGMDSLQQLDLGCNGVTLSDPAECPTWTRCTVCGAVWHLTSSV